MTDDTNTIRRTLVALRERGHADDGYCLCCDHEPDAALARVEARLAAPCHCDKCLDCLAADGYETAIERAEQAERERDEAVADADRLREALREARWFVDSVGRQEYRWGGHATGLLSRVDDALAGPQTEEKT